MTPEQVQSALERNTGYISNNIRTTFINSRIALAVVHDKEIVENRPYVFSRSGPANNVIVTPALIRRVRDSSGRETELVLMYMNVSIHFRNIAHLFDFTYDSVPPDEPVGSILCLDDPQTSVANMREVRSEERPFTGWAFSLNEPTSPGDCGTPLIRLASPCIVMGFHVARCGSLQSNCVALPSTEYQAFLQVLDIAFPTADKGDFAHKHVFFDNKLPSMPEIKNEVASPRVCTSFLRNQGEECTSTPPSVVVLGHDASVRRTNRSEVVITPMSASLEAAGWPREHAAPPLNSNRAASAALQFAARGAQSRSVAVNEAVI